MLKKLGADLIFNSSDASFESNLRVAASTLNATICFEAIAGEMTGIVLKNMPNNSTVYVYGLLSEKPCVIGGDDLIFRGKTVTGFHMGE